MTMAFGSLLNWRQSVIKGSDIITNQIEFYISAKPCNQQLHFALMQNARIFRSKSSTSTIFLKIKTTHFEDDYDKSNLFFHNRFYVEDILIERTKYFSHIYD